VLGSSFFVVVGVLSSALPVLTIALGTVWWVLAGGLSLVVIQEGPLAPVTAALVAAVPISQFSGGGRAPQSVFVAFAVVLVVGSMVATSVETYRRLQRWMLSSMLNAMLTSISPAT
jgi:hypothetical protein